MVQTLSGMGVPTQSAGVLSFFALHPQIKPRRIRVVLAIFMVTEWRYLQNIGRNIQKKRLSDERQPLLSLV